MTSALRKFERMMLPIAVFMGGVMALSLAAALVMAGFLRMAVFLGEYFR